jgi:phosphoketolase
MIAETGLTNATEHALTPDLLRQMDAYWRAANYLSVGQIYLYDNPLLREPLKLSHVKPLVVGHWGYDVIDRLPHLGSQGAYLKQTMQDKLIEHKQYIDKHGQDLPEVRNWKWMNPTDRVAVSRPLLDEHELAITR